MCLVVRANCTFRIGNDEVNRDKIAKLLGRCPKVRRRTSSVALNLNLPLLTRMTPGVLGKMGHQMIGTGCFLLEITNAVIIRPIPNKPRPIIIATCLTNLNLNWFRILIIGLTSFLLQLTLSLSFAPSLQLRARRNSSLVQITSRFIGDRARLGRLSNRIRIFGQFFTEQFIE